MQLSNFNEGHYSILYLVLAMVITYIAVVTGIAQVEIIGAAVTKAGVFLVSAFTLLKAFGTIKLDVMNEIVEKKNDPLSRVVQALIIGLALVIMI